MQYKLQIHSRTASVQRLCFEVDFDKAFFSEAQIWELKILKRIKELVVLTDQ